MLRSLPPGDYSVPLVIGDRQGLSQKQRVHVRVCSCPGGSTCAAEPSAAGLELPALLFAVFTALAGQRSRAVQAVSQGRSPLKGEQVMTESSRLSRE